MTQRDAEAPVGRERPGRRVLEAVGLNDGRAPAFEIAVEQAGGRRVLLVAGDRQIVGERH